MMTDLIYDGKPSRRKFQREGLKIGIRNSYGHEPQTMGDIKDGVSHFLYREKAVWLPKQRYDQTLKEKQERRRLTAERWIQGLADGTFRNRAEIARLNGITRSRVTQFLNEYERVNHA